MSTFNLQHFPKYWKFIQIYKSTFDLSRAIESNRIKTSLLRILYKLKTMHLVNQKLTSYEKEELLREQYCWRSFSNYVNKT